ncbi:vegetative cell wall protein gp1-like [Ornithorhynchus anatinus]|uniref:vegetative cell wall protein gp1-like n=1 Tax=Ornithorhynchus anatinus TaxID=9258 RepID=UPI0010A75F13|nr:vegetative cell wall protein gp1-like [Ornithorhynchus anatinus]
MATPRAAGFGVRPPCNKGGERKSGMEPLPRGYPDAAGEKRSRRHRWHPKPLGREQAASKPPLPPALQHQPDQRSALGVPSRLLPGPPQAPGREAGSRARSRVPGPVMPPHPWEPMWVCPAGASLRSRRCGLSSPLRPRLLSPRRSQSGPQPTAPAAPTSPPPGQPSPPTGPGLSAPRARSPIPGMPTPPLHSFDRI